MSAEVMKDERARRKVYVFFTATTYISSAHDQLNNARQMLRSWDAPQEIIDQLDTALAALEAVRQPVHDAAYEALDDHTARVLYRNDKARMTD